MKSANSYAGQSPGEHNRFGSFEKSPLRPSIIKAQHAMVLDANGNAAVVKLRDLPHGILRACHGLKVMETNEVIKKPSARFAFPLIAPVAHIIYAQSRYGVHEFGEQKAIVWAIGLQTIAGFSLPSVEVINQLYIVTDKPSDFK